MILTRTDRDRLVAMLKAYASSSSQTYAGAVLVETMRKARVVEPKAVPPSVVTMNSVVSLIDIASGVISRFALVYPADANVDALKVSILAPLGAAMLGRSEGEIIEVDGPAGPRRYFIQKVAFQPESRLRTGVSATAQ